MSIFGTIMAGLGISALSQGVSEGVGQGMNLLFNGSNRHQIKLQEEAQKRLNEQAAAVNYKYGERSAENAYQRQMKMYERSYEDQSYKAMRGQMEDAGLNVGLMYGGAGSGGGAGSMTGAPQGATGGAQAGNAAAMLSAAIEMQRLSMDRGLATAQTEKLLAEKDEIKTKTEKEKAETSQIQTATEQAQESFEWVLKDLEETARGKTLENIARKFNMEAKDLSEEKEINDEKFGKIMVKASGLFNSAAVTSAQEMALKKEDIDGANMLRKAQALFEDEKTKWEATRVFTAVWLAQTADTDATTKRLEYELHKTIGDIGVKLTEKEIEKIAQDLKLNPDKVGAEIDKMEAETEKAEFESGPWAKAKLIVTCIAALSGAYAAFYGTNAKIAGTVLKGGK